MSKTTICHLMFICIIAASRCSSPPKQPVVVENSHPVSIAGIVTSKNRINIDKSGNNSRFMLHFLVTIEFYDDGGWYTILGPEIKCVMKEEDLLKQTGRKLNAGDRVLIITHITETTPEVIAVYSVKFFEKEDNYDKVD